MPDEVKGGDPSENVKMLVGNAVEYLKDMHQLQEKYFENKLQQSVETSRREAQTETNRIDACRRDDNEAVKVANAMADKKAEVLAANMAENAETLRAGMAKTAETLALQLQQVTASLAERLKIVEEKQYSLAGNSKGRGDMWAWISAGAMLLILLYKFLFPT